MRKIILFLVLLFELTSVFSQNNLVLNGNFEDTIICPQQGSIYYTDEIYKYWKSATIGTPDYFNVCSPVNVSIPDNRVGSQVPVSGVGYSGFFFSIPYINMREYITGKLHSELLMDSTYMVSFYVSTADNSRNAIDFIGAYLSKDSVFKNDDMLLPFVPQVESDSGVILDYKTSWHEIKGIYKAEGGEKHITLGCFREWEELSWKTYTPPVYIGEGAYYYVDSVSVLLYTKPDSIPVPPPTPNPTYSLYPNPTKENVIISFDDILPEKVEIELYDMLGRKIFIELPQSNSQIFEVNLENLAAGVYVYKLNVNGGYFGDGKLVIVR